MPRKDTTIGRGESRLLLAASIAAAQDLVRLFAGWGLAYLDSLIRIDSSSDERSGTVPSTPGQLALLDFLREVLGGFGYQCETDASGALLAHVGANLPAGSTCPPVAFITHIDNSLGTVCPERLTRVERWDGSRLAYPGNQRLNVSVAAYPALQAFVGHDVLHGPGTGPVGLDDKLGVAEVLTLARYLAEHPEIRHGTIVLCFRPDEEIGRDEAVQSLARRLAELGVTRAYTVDGHTAFEVSTVCFNASEMAIRVPAPPLHLTDSVGEPQFRCARTMRLRIQGVRTHGATAKAEGYRNAVRIFTAVMSRMSSWQHVVPVEFTTDPADETAADVTMLIRGRDESELDRWQSIFVTQLGQEVAPHAERGAGQEVMGTAAVAPTDGQGFSDGLRKIITIIVLFQNTPSARPLFSEDSEGWEGYSNPFTITRDGDHWIVRFRLRDFDPRDLARREDHVQRVAHFSGLPEEAVHHRPQYRDISPRLESYPELVAWAEAAAERISASIQRHPIRGGTGVGPFLDAGIGVANLGTGYHGLESPTELTSLEMIGRHAEWLVALVEVVAAVRTGS